MKGYSVKRSVVKALPPVVGVALAEGLFTVAQCAGWDVLTKDHCYQVSLSALAIWAAGCNWWKNRKRGR